MFHVLAFTGSIAGTANTDLPALTDDMFQIRNGHFVFEKPMQIVFIAAIGNLLDRARINLPSVRGMSLPFIRPITVGTLMGTPPAVQDFRDHPFTIQPMEEFAMQVSNSGAGPTRTQIVVGIQERMRTAPEGTIITMRGTGTTTLVANTWTTCTITWADTLPPGVYAIVGLEVITVSGVAARLQIPGQIDRPGCLGTATINSQPHPMFMEGGLGHWGEFESINTPGVQVLATAADTAQEVFLQVVKVR